MCGCARLEGVVLTPLVLYPAISTALVVINDVLVLVRCIL